MICHNSTRQIEMMITLICSKKQMIMILRVKIFFEVISNQME